MPATLFYKSKTLSMTYVSNNLGNIRQIMLCPYDGLWFPTLKECGKEIFTEKNKPIGW